MKNIFKQDTLEIMYHYESNSKTKEELDMIYLCSNISSFVNTGRFIIGHSHSECKEDDFYNILEDKESDEYIKSEDMNFSESIDKLNEEDVDFWYISKTDYDAINESKEILGSKSEDFNKFDKIYDLYYQEKSINPRISLFDFFVKLSIKDLELFKLKSENQLKLLVNEYLTY